MRLKLRWITILLCVVVPGIRCESLLHESREVIAEAIPGSGYQFLPDHALLFLNLVKEGLPTTRPESC
jgi:hypothetical protein